MRAGSYPDPKAAEELKAKLALSGFVARVQSVNVNGKTWHRVRVGPYSSASDVETAKAALSEAGVNAIALKDAGEMTIRQVACAAWRTATSRISAAETP